MSTQYALRPDVVAWSGSGAEFVLLDLRTSTYLGVTSGAAVLWARLAEGPVNRNGLAQILVDAFGIDAATAGADSAEFIDDLLARGFVRADPADDPE